MRLLCTMEQCQEIWRCIGRGRGLTQDSGRMEGVVRRESEGGMERGAGRNNVHRRDRQGVGIKG